MYGLMRIRLTVLLLFCELLLAFQWLPSAVGGTYEVTLLTPRLASVSTEFTPPGHGVPLQVDVDVHYDALGVANCVGTFNGTPALCTGRVAAKVGRVAYHFTLRDPNNSGFVVSLSGVSTSNTVRVTYKGPPVPLRGLELPVTIDADSAVTASIVVSPTISAKNVITGSGTIETGFITNVASVGTVRGKVSAKGLVWVVKHGTRTARFQGKRVGDSFVGTLRIVAKPAVETWRNFSIPASDFSLVAGAATFRGTLAFVGEAGPISAAGATVTVLSDLDGDGIIAGKELGSANPGADGRYEVKFNVLRDRPVRVEIHQNDFADVLIGYASVSPGAIVTKNAVAVSLDSLIVTQGTAASPDENIRFSDLPQTIPRLSARVFNPALEAAQFPGAFTDGQGGFLVPGAFAVIEAQDTQGRAVTNIGADVTLSILVPVDSWAGVDDETPGNGQIDVPFYFYDRELARWTTNSSVGWLEDRARNRIAESELAAIRAGTYLSDVFAASAVSRFGYWSLGWPASSNTAFRGVIVDTNGFRLSGVMVEVRGATYPGVGSPMVTTEDGQFCAEALRSELAGEDHDRDGISNETHQATIVVRWHTNLFEFGPVTCPAASAPCGSGGELMAGMLMLAESNRLTASVCTVTGRVVYSGRAVGEVPQLTPGAGVPAAFVSVIDPDALDATGCAGTSCGSVLTDADGGFSLTAPLMTGAGLYVTSHSVAGGAIGSYRARANLTNCPAGSQLIYADYVNFGFFVCQIFDNQTDIGVLTIIDSMLDVYISTEFIVVGHVPDTELPGQIGPWISVPLQMGDVGGPPDGSITFTVTQLEPIGGTWQRSSPSGNSSGGWIQVLPGP